MINRRSGKVMDHEEWAKRILLFLIFRDMRFGKRC